LQGIGIVCDAYDQRPRADIVLVDDHPEHLDYLATLLRRAGYRGAAFNRAAPALCHLKRYPPRLVITDVFTPEKDGFEVLQAVRDIFPICRRSR
jgi:DNA-binding response OmpR family regulator